MHHKLKALGLALVIALVPGLALADTISPDTFETTLDVGESTTITKTVTVSEGRPTTAKVDVFFLADTTGSMSGQIAAARANATDIMNNLSSLGDVWFGAGNYGDITDPVFTYRQDAALSSSQATAQAGIDTWTAFSGGDFPEANLIALERVAREEAWRDGSKRIIVTFGDAPGHIGRLDDEPDAFGNFITSSETNAIAELVGNDIIVHLGNTTGDDPTSGMNAAAGGAAAGQANRIAAATDGSVFELGSSGEDIADLIIAAIEASFADYSEVSLMVNAVPGVDVEVSPLAYNGEYDRSEERTFDFEVTFTGVTPGIHEFTIDALVDGGIVGTENDIITVRGDVPPPSAVPLPAALPLYGAGMAILGFIGWRKRRRS
jgi:hypothetical protein